jgi:hypothetical protein
MKQAIFIMTDPRSGSDEATSRALNALAMADECRRSGDELAIVFAGAGTRWPEELSKLSHPANARYNAVREFVRGASRSCAMRNGATAGVENAGVALIGDNEVAGTAGVASFRRYYAEGWNVTVF